MEKEKDDSGDLLNQGHESILSGLNSQSKDCCALDFKSDYKSVGGYFKQLHTFQTC